MAIHLSVVMPAYNVLEHLQEEGVALASIRSALEPGGRAVVLVPRGPQLYGSLDEVLGHVRRYTRSRPTSRRRPPGRRPSLCS